MAAIAGKKLYALKMDPATAAKHMSDATAKGDKKAKPWKKACKGVDLPPEDIVRIARGETITHRKDAPSMRIGVKGSTVSFVERRVRRTA